MAKTKGIKLNASWDVDTVLRTEATPITASTTADQKLAFAEKHMLTFLINNYSAAMNIQSFLNKSFMHYQNKKRKYLNNQSFMFYS